MKKTNKDRVLEYLKDFGSITSLEAFRDLGNTRLSATIFLLRQDGYVITSKNTKGLNRYGDTTYYTTYILER